MITIENEIHNSSDEWVGVVKVQRPIFTNIKNSKSRSVENDFIYIYNEDRSIDQLLPKKLCCEETTKKLFPNGELKTYWKIKVTKIKKTERKRKLFGLFHVTYRDEDVSIEFIKKVEDKDW